MNNRQSSFMADNILQSERAIQLPIVKIGKEKYFQDDRLNEFRSVKTSPWKILKYSKYRSADECLKDYNILSHIKTIDHKIWCIEYQQYKTDDSPIMFEFLQDFEKLSEMQIAQKVVEWYKENAVIKMQKYQECKFPKGTAKKCPVCDKKLVVGEDNFNIEEVSHQFICFKHSLSELNKCITIQDEILIAYLKAKEENKTLILLPREYTINWDWWEHGY